MEIDVEILLTQTRVINTEILFIQNWVVQTLERWYANSKIHLICICTLWWVTKQAYKVSYV